MSLPSWARVGASVVCVIAHEDHRRLIVGGIYHIAAVGEPYMGKATIVLAEHDNPSDIYDGAYYVGRFRPLITIEDDLAAYFTAILHQPSSIKEPAL